MNGWTNIWEILGISYTTDISEIKRAYASRAKDCHPEDHPEEFNRLQKAYKTAMQIAKNRKAYEKALEEAKKNTPEEVSLTEMVLLHVLHMEESTSEEDESPSESPESVGYRSAFEKQDVRFGGNSDFHESKPEPVEPHFSSYFDYGEVQDQDNWRKQQVKADIRRIIMHIIWNPYARNNVLIWDYFFHGQEQREVFGDLEFRVEFVRLLYQERFAGWHRDQILFFREYLGEFQLDGQPSPELQMRQWNWLLENAGTGQELLDSPFLTSEELQNYSVINFGSRSRMSVLHGELAKTKEEQYLAWYMAYAEKNEDKLRALYRDWVTLREQRFEHRDVESIEKRTLYMIWNPYVRNNINMWKCFLNGKRTRELFGDRGFRLMFSRQICRARFAGWQRDQITFLWQFLADFESDGRLPGDFPGKEWSQIFWSAPKSGRTGVFSFFTEKEKAAYDDLYTKEIFEGVEPEPSRSFEEQYLDWYWKYAEQNEEALASIYERWTILRRKFYYFAKFLWTLPAVAVVLLVLFWEIFVYKPYGIDLHRYQKMHEQFQDLEENQEEQYWKEVKQQALEELEDIQ